MRPFRRVFCFSCFLYLLSNAFPVTILAGTSIYVGDPAPSPGLVSRIPILVDGIDGPGWAGFDISVKIESSAGVHKVNAATQPSELVPGEEGNVYDETGITVYLPLKGIDSDPERNESGLGSDFMDGQGSDGILELANQSGDEQSGRVAYVYQSRDDVSPFSGGELFHLFLYVGKNAPSNTMLSVAVLDHGSPRLAKFDGVEIAPETVEGYSATLFLAGDVDGNGTMELNDALLVLQLLTRQTQTLANPTKIDGDGKTGLAEVGWILRRVAEAQ